MGFRCNPPETKTRKNDPCTQARNRILLSYPALGTPQTHNIVTVIGDVLYRRVIFFLHAPNLQTLNLHSWSAYNEVGCFFFLSVSKSKASEFCLIVWLMVTEIAIIFNYLGSIKKDYFFFTWVKCCWIDFPTITNNQLFKSHISQWCSLSIDLGWCWFFISRRGKVSFLEDIQISLLSVTGSLCISLTCDKCTISCFLLCSNTVPFP